MDWQTFLASVVTSLLSSSAIAAGLVYVMKRSFDRALDLKYEQILEQYRLTAKEGTRRSADLFDLQARAFREILTQVYRIRNATRKLRDMVHYGRDEQEIDELIVNIREHDNTFSELLYAYRAVLPDDFFRMAHEVNHQTVILQGESPGWDKYKVYQQLPEMFDEIDKRYRDLVGVVQNNLGVEKENSQLSQATTIKSKPAS